MKRLLTFLAIGISVVFVLSHSSEAPAEPCDPEKRYSSETLIPPNYLDFQPPPKGQSYIDPTFCTEVKRLTDSANGYVTNSEIVYFNIDDSYFIATDDNITYLFDGDNGNLIKEIGGGTLRPWWIRWARGDYYTLSEVKHTFDPAQHFYKYEGNDVRLYNVNTLDYVVLHTFAEYSEIGPAGGEGDISADGRYWVFHGKRTSDGGLELFAYDLLDDAKGAVTPFEIGDVGGNGSGVDYATISPSGHYVLIAWDAGMSDPFNDHYGIEVFERETWTFLRRVHPSRIHFELGYDAFGDEVFFSAAGNTVEEIATFGIPDLALGDQISVRLEDGFCRKLLDMPRWAHFISAFAQGENRYIFIAYETRSDIPEEDWSIYWGEIFAVPTDGSGNAVRLVHHRSRQVGEQSHKAYQPDFFTNNAGTKIVFNSTFGIGGADLYLLDISDVIEPANPDIVISGLGEMSGGYIEAFGDDYSYADWLRVNWFAYNSTNGEARVATGDVDGDGRDEVVLGLGPVDGNPSLPGGWFELLDDDYSHLAWGRINWSSYNSANGESWPACGDVDGDGRDEIIIGLGSGGRGNFEVFEYSAGSLAHAAWVKVNWSSYNNANGETRPACGDVDGDGRDEVIIGLGSASGGYLEVFDDATAGYSHLAWPRVLWAAYNSANGETRPACGDVDGDGRDEIVVGLGQGAEGYLEVFDDATAGYAHMAWPRVQWWTYNSTNGQTRPACGDVDGDGRDEIVVGLGQGAVGYLEVFDDATAGYAHLAWPRVEAWTYNFYYWTYISSNGETRPACGDVDGDGRDEIVVGLGQGAAGYLGIMDDASTGYGHLAWPRVQWWIYNSANGESWPAVKK